MKLFNIFIFLDGKGMEARFLEDDPEGNFVMEHKSE